MKTQNLLKILTFFVIGSSSLMAEDAVIKMAPFVVSEGRWYAGTISVPGLAPITVLSSCSESRTQDFISNFVKNRLRLRDVIPDNLTLNVPMTMVLIDKGLEGGMQAKVLAGLKSQALTQDTARFLDDTVKTVGTDPQMSLMTTDRIVSSFILDSSLFSLDSLGQGQASLTGDYVLGLLRHRTPSIQSWFVYGVAGSFYWMTWSGGSVSLPRLQYEEPILSMDEIFKGPSFLVPRDGLSKERMYKIYESQAHLFTCWAFDTGHADALYRAADKLMTEPLFRELFGMSYKAMRKELQDYVATAESSTTVLRKMVTDPVVPSLELHEASRLEVADCLGEMTLAQSDDFRTSCLRNGRKDLIVGDPYIREAGEILVKTYERKDIDRQGSDFVSLQGLLGTYFFVTRQYDKALAFLTESAMHGVSRPSVYAELALVRGMQVGLYFPFLARDRKRLDPKQVQYLLAPLEVDPAGCLKQPQAVLLLMATLEDSENPPSADSLQLVDTAVGFYPHISDFLLGAAKAYAKAGLVSKAEGFVDHGLDCYPSPSVRAELVALRTSLENTGRGSR